MRTGAIFARGNCRALKWVALLGVVFALGAGSVLAQGPPPPVGFSAEPTTADDNDADSGAMKLSWSRSANSATLIGYEWRSAEVDPGTGTAGGWSALLDRETEETTTGQLAAGQAYTFELRAVHEDGDDDGTENDVSEGVLYTARAIGIPPDIAAATAGGEALAAVPGDKMVTLTWANPHDPPGQPVAGFRHRYAWDSDASGTIGDGEDWNDWVSVSSSTLTVVVGNLVNGREYSFQVQATNKAGTSENAASATPIIPRTTPSMPQLLEPNNKVAREITLTWRTPESDGGNAIVRYEYRYREEDDTDWATWTTTVLNTEITVEQLKPHRLYHFEVAAVNAAGRGDVATVSEEATGPDQAPSAPGKPTAVSGNEMVTLTWTAPSSDGGEDITRYDYERSDDPDNWHEFPALTLTQPITGLRNGQSYTFRVRAVNDVGTGEESASSDPVTPGATAPGVPQDLVASSSRDGSGNVWLYWNPPENDGGAAITRYEYQVDDGAWEIDTSLTTSEDGSGRQWVQVTGLNPGTTYSFRVRAVNSVGPGAATNAVTATPTAPTPEYIPVEVKSVKSSATSVDESGGLEVTVTATVPAGTKVDGKVPSIPSKMVVVWFPVDNEAIKYEDQAEPSDTTLLGTADGYADAYVWTDIPRGEKATEATFKFRVAIGQDLDAEDEEFEIAVSIDGEPQRTKVITINDAQEQKFKLTLKSDEKAKNTIKEGGYAELRTMRS